MDAIFARSMMLCVLVLGMGGGGAVLAQEPRPAKAPESKSSKDIIQKKKVETDKEQVRPTARATTAAPRQKVIVPRKQVRRHIRLSLPTDERNEIDYHGLMTRSTRNFGFSLDYFDADRRREIEVTIASFRENRRDEGYNHWMRFVSSLDSFDKPVDLEPVLYYVLREGCLRQDTNVLFYAERLERFRVDLENIEEYWDDLYRLHQQCDAPGGGCLEPVERRIDEELEVLRQERDLAQAKVNVAQRGLERAQITSSGEVSRSADYFYVVAQELARRTEYVLYAD